MRKADREKLRKYLLALAIKHEKCVVKLPKWARKPVELMREYSPPEAS